MNSIGSALTILDDKYIRTHRSMNVWIDISRIKTKLKESKVKEM